MYVSVPMKLFLDIGKIIKYFRYVCVQFLTLVALVEHRLACLMSVASRGGAAPPSRQDGLRPRTLCALPEWTAHSRTGNRTKTIE